MTQLARRQHKIPREYLRAFCDSRGDVHTYDILQDTMRHGAVDDTAVEAHAYSFRRITGERDHAFDIMLQSVENVGNPILKVLRESRKLDEYDSIAFSIYAAAMYLRTDAFRLLFAQTHIGLIEFRNQLVAENDRAFEAEMRAYEQAVGPLTDELKQQLREFMRDPSEHTFALSKPYTLRVFNLMRDVAHIFNTMGVVLLVNDTNVPFITSDNPVMPSVERREQDRPLISGGLLDPDIEVHFPLSPTCCWVALHRPGRAVFQVNREHVKGVNRKTAATALQFLYADRSTAGIRKLGQKYKGNLQRVEKGGRPFSDVTLARGR